MALIDPINFDTTPDEDETLFQCACGDPSCKGHNDNIGNRRIRGEWFAEGCKVAESHPDVVGDVMAAILSDERIGK